MDLNFLPFARFWILSLGLEYKGHVSCLERRHAKQILVWTLGEIYDFWRPQRRRGLKREIHRALEALGFKSVNFRTFSGLTLHSIVTGVNIVGEVGALCHLGCQGRSH